MNFEDRWFITNDELRLYARDYASARGRIPVLCMHGLTRNSADFEALATALSGSTRVIVMDQRGRGRSQWDPHPVNYNVVTYVGDTFAMLDHLGIDKVVLIGTSMGGLMAMLMATMQLDRIAGIVLNDVGPAVEPAGIARIQSYVGKGGAVASWDEATQAVRATSEIAFPDWDDGAWLKFAKKLFVEKVEGVLEPAYDSAISKPLDDDQASIVPPDLWPVFDALTATPMLVLRGALSDILAAETVDEMDRRHPGLVRVEVAHRGHAPTLDEPDAREAVMDFVTSLVSTAMG